MSRLHCDRASKLRMRERVQMQVANAVVAAYESGELLQALKDGPDAYKTWVKALGKSQKRKGKRLFMPLRVALTGNTHVSCQSCLDAQPLHLHQYMLAAPACHHCIC